MYKAVLILLLFSIVSIARSGTVYVGFDTMYVDEQKALIELLPDSLQNRFDSVMVMNDFVVISSETISGLKSGFDVVEFFDSEHQVIASVSIQIVAPVPVESVSINTDTIYLKEGDVHKIEFTIIPDNATFSSISWEVSQPDVIDVADDGTITATRFGLSKVNLVINPQNINTSVFVSVQPKCNLLRPDVNDTVRICSGKKALFMASSSNITWYNDIELTELQGKGAFFSPEVSTAGLYRFYVVQEVGACKSDPAEAVLEVFSLPEAPLKEEFSDRYEPVDISDPFYFREEMNWYQNSSLIYSGKGFPENIKEGTNQYSVAYYDQCESRKTDVSFEYAVGAVLQVKGNVNTYGDLCRVQLINAENMDVEAEIGDVNGAFVIETSFKGSVYLKAVPGNAENYYATYLGNTLFVDESTIINLDEMNVGGLDIDLQEKQLTSLIDEFSCNDVLESVTICSINGSILGTYEEILVRDLMSVLNKFGDVICVVKLGDSVVRFMY